MATYCLDYKDGLDTNDGSPGAPWKTVNHTLSPGDIVKHKKSPAPTSIGNATWNTLSKTVTLAAAKTKTIELCESVWTGSANVTVTNSSSRKEGTFAQQIAVAAGFTTGLVAYKALGAAEDFSGYKQVSFWVRVNAALAASTLSLRLCSDTAGLVTVDTIPIPAMPGINLYAPITVDLGTALGSSIQSVALYADADPGAVTVLIDNIIACLDSADADSLSLTSLISKNVGTAEDSIWYPIQSIVGTTVLIDGNTNTAATAGKGYSGTTETVETFKRETTKIDMAATATTPIFRLLNSGTAGNLISQSGGWSDDFTAQDGETVYDCQNGNGYLFEFPNPRNYFSLSRFVGVRGNIGIQATQITRASISQIRVGGFTNGYNVSGMTLSSVDDVISYNNNNASQLTNGINRCAIKNIRQLNGTAGGFSLNNLFQCVLENIYARNNTNGQISIGTASWLNRLINIESYDGSNTGGLDFSGANQNWIYKLTTSGNSAGGVRLMNSSLTQYGYDCVIGESTEVSSPQSGGVSDYCQAAFVSENHGGVKGYTVIFGRNHRIVKDTAVVYTPGGYSWQISPMSTTIEDLNPVELPLLPIKLTSGVQKTISLRVRRDNSGLTLHLFLPGGVLAGIDQDQVASASGPVDEWEQLSLTVTPTETGYIRPVFQAHGGSTYNGWADDLAVT